MWADNAIQELSEGRGATVKPSGNSMTPLIRSKEEVFLLPFSAGDPISKGDIVLCKVKGHVYLHKVLQVGEGKVLIGNNKGGTNGWTALEKIFGVAVAVNGDALGKGRRINSVGMEEFYENLHKDKWWECFESPLQLD